MNHSGNSLSEQARKWVVDAVHPSATIFSVNPLKGGISSLVHGITLLADGIEREVVLRQIDNNDWLRSQPDVTVQEAASLQRAARATGVQIPELIAFDESGNSCGMPAVLMTRLEGEVDLEPMALDRWLDGLAAALVKLHLIEPDDFPWTFRPYSDASKLDTSAWSKIPEVWQAAASIVTKRTPAYTKRFIHRDYHPANVLWKGGEVSGVIDWVNGCVGPAGVDVGHCRVNLALLHGTAAADSFLSRYLYHAESDFIYDPYWDLVTLIDFAFWRPEVYGGWTALGVEGLTDELIMERLDAYLLSLKI